MTVANERALPVSISNPGALFTIPTPITLELYDHAGTKKGSVVGYYAIDRAANRATLWLPALTGTLGQAGAMTVKGAAGADLPALIQLSAWVTDIDVVVISNVTKYAGTLGKATNGTFSLTRTDADFATGVVGGLPGVTQFDYPIAVDATITEVAEFETVLAAQGFASITDFVQQMKTLQTTAITNT